MKAKIDIEKAKGTRIFTKILDSYMPGELEEVKFVENIEEGISSFLYNVKVSRDNAKYALKTFCIKKSQSLKKQRCFLRKVIYGEFSFKW